MGDADDPFDLGRFIAAQDRVWEDVAAELKIARKSSHWMWFVFPQIAGLGLSPTAQRYAIGSLAEAQAYLAHPMLGARLREAVGWLLAAPPDRTAHEILGSPDELKLRSCLTLFDRAAPEEPLFRQALDRFYDAAPDQATLRLIGSA